MRGIMKFDDYNYSNYNSYILIEQPSHLEKQTLGHLLDNLCHMALEKLEGLPEHQDQEVLDVKVMQQAHE